MTCGKPDPLLRSPAPTAADSRRAGKRRFLYFLTVAAALLTSYHLLLAPPPASRYHALFLTLGSNATAAAHLHALTLRPHVAGTEANSTTAEYVRAALAFLSFPTRVVPYSVLLSYPALRSLSLAARAFSYEQT
jgi:N-acetylated-alpha-linked acidic dipeptidase